MPAFPEVGFAGILLLVIGEVGPKNEIQLTILRLLTPVRDAKPRTSTLMHGSKNRFPQTRSLAVP